MNINSLPDLCLRKIFAKLPLGDVIQAGQVCKLWKLYQEEITNKIQLKALTVWVDPELRDGLRKFSTDPFKTSWFTVPYLEEVINDDGTPMYAPQYNDKQCHLWFSTLETCTINALARLFPDVTTLEIVIRYVPYSTINQLIHLIEQWSDQLISLKVFGEINQIEPYTSIERTRLEQVVIAKKLLQLLQTIDLLPNLNHLSFEIRNDIFESSFENPLELKESKLYPKFSQVKELYINTVDLFRIMTPFANWLENLASENHRLERFGIGNTDKRVAIVSLSRSETIARKLTVTPFVYWENTEEFHCSEDNAIIFRRLTSLTSLRYEYFPSSSFKDIMNGLGPLRKLLYLHMDFYLKVEANETNKFGEPKSSQLSKFDSISKYDFAQLSSVKILSLSIRVSKHSDFASRHWGWIFPEVQVIIISHTCKTGYECDQYETDIMKNISDKELTEGIRELIRTFKQCPKLRKIITKKLIAYTCSWDSIEWRIDEI